MNFELFAHHGYGAYICGEETALLESLEGKKGQPRFKPPFPASFGLYGKPTTINNTETFSSVPFIIRDGGQAFADKGIPNAGGTKLFCISGHVERPGNYEVPLGTPFAEVLKNGGRYARRKKLKAVIPGGSSAPVLPADIMMQTNMDYDSISKDGLDVGFRRDYRHGEDVCMVKALERLSYFTTTSLAANVRLAEKVRAGFTASSTASWKAKAAWKTWICWIPSATKWQAALSAPSPTPPSSPSAAYQAFP